MRGIPVHAVNWIIDQDEASVYRAAISVYTRTLTTAHIPHSCWSSRCRNNRSRLYTALHWERERKRWGKYTYSGEPDISMFQHPPPSLTPLGPLIMNVSLRRSSGIGQISPTSKWTERWKKEIDQYIYRINVSWHDFISWLVPIFAWKAFFSHPVMPSTHLHSQCLYNLFLENLLTGICTLQFNEFNYKPKWQFSFLFLLFEIYPSIYLSIINQTLFNLANIKILYH